MVQQVEKLPCKSPKGPARKKVTFLGEIKQKNYKISNSGNDYTHNPLRYSGHARVLFLSARVLLVLCAFSTSCAQISTPVQPIFFRQLVRCFSG